MFSLLYPVSSLFINPVIIFRFSYACKVFESNSAPVCKPPESKHTFSPTGGKKNTHTHLLCTNAWPLDFSRSLWNFPPIQHLKNEAIRHTQTWIVALARLPVLLLPVAFLHIPPKTAFNRPRKGTGLATVALHLASPHAFETRGELTVVAVEFGAVDPAAPRLSQHYFWTRQRSPLRNSRHCCGAFSPLDLLLLLQLLPGRSALLPPDVILGPFRHSFRYNVTTQQSALLALGIGGTTRWLTRPSACRLIARPSKHNTHAKAKCGHMTSNK